jgi:hypothetical protein
MTNKDYLLIARVLQEERTSLSKKCLEEKRRAIDSIEFSLVRAFELDNPRFSAFKFIDAATARFVH